MLPTLILLTINLKKINFSYELKKNILNHPMSLNMTSSKHLYPKLKKIFCTTESNLNNLDNQSNTVNMNHERIKFLENSLRYQAEIAFLNNNIKNITYILQRG
ncbi:hypothetical protein HIC20_01545 [Buchnera aphidicola (Hormaphis cornu)]|nr:hypothetical protein HIC20_01545 [Buchnera aphidicola (Hormaphis cornu)]